MADVVIIGAGPAGLAVAACLRRHGLRPLVVDRQAGCGGSFRTHYECLRLHTTRRQSTLPYLSYPAGTSRHPSRAELLAYLRRYRELFAPELELGCEVRGAWYDGRFWRLDTLPSALRARALVLACGFQSEPILPSVPDLGSFSGELLHSSNYRHAAPFVGKRVLVVGAGNSGADIATDLVSSGAAVTWSIRGSIFAVPMSLLGIHWRTLYEFAPNKALPIAKRLGFGSLARRAIARAWEQIEHIRFAPVTTAIPLADASSIERHFESWRPPLTNTEVFGLVAAERLSLKPALASFQEESVRFSDGSAEPFDTVIFATGYAPAKLIGALLGNTASVRDGVISGKPGLFVCGSRPELSQIGASAKRVAREVMRYLTAQNAISAPSVGTRPAKASSQQAPDELPN